MDLFKLVGSIFIKNDNADKSIDTTASKAKNMGTVVGSAMEKAGSKITTVGKALAPISAVAAAAFGASVKGASDFSNGMAKMSTLFDTTKTSVQDLSKDFLDLSNKTGISATELAEAGYQALSAGQSVDQVGKFVETAGNLAKAGFTSSATAVDVLTTALNAYKGKCGTAEEVANKLVRTQNLGKTTVDELASSMGKIIPTASGMNVDINNLTSGYVSLTKQGIATAEATTYMNSMFNELGDSGTTLGSIIFDLTGKSFQELMSEGYSVADVLKITKDHADDVGIAYNELWGSAEAGKAGMAILNGGVEEFNSTVETMKSNVDDVGDALDKLETPSVKVNKSLNRIKNSGIQLGSAFLTAVTPTLDKVSGAIEKATNWFGNLDEKTKTTIATVTGVVAVMSPVLMIVGKVVTVGGSLIKTITNIQTSTTGLSAVFGAITSPIGLAVIAIGGLVAAFVALYNHNEEFRNKVNEVWDSVKTKISGIVESLQALIQAGIERMKQILQFFVDFGRSLWETFGEDITNVMSNLFDYLATIVQTGLDVIQGIINVVTAVIQGDWSGAWEAVKNLASSVWEGIKNIVETGIEYAKSVLNLGMKVLSTAWTTAWTAVQNLLKKVWEAIKNVVSTAIKNVQTTIQNILKAIQTFFSNVWNAIKKTIESVWNAIKNTITTVLNAIKSVVTNIWNAIKSFINSVLNGIKSVITSVWNAIKSAVTTVLNAIKSVITTVWNAIKSTVITVINSIKSVVSNGFNAVKTTVTNVMNGVKTTISTAWNTAKTSVSTAITGIKSTVSSGLNAAKTTVSNIFTAIKTKIKSIMDGAKTAVGNAITAIKSKFKFSWSLPKLKLPHISISGKFSINPPSVPHFSISWYKKAMDNPFLLTQPTVFRVNPVTGQAKAGGEAGDEMIYGHQNLLNDIRNASGSNVVVETLNAWMEKIYNILVQHLPALKNMVIVLEDSTLVGKITPKIDKELGKIYASKARGI